MNAQIICQFCEAECSYLYPVRLKENKSGFYVCKKCASCQVSPAFSEEELIKNYEEDYFQAENWEIKKARILAIDYFGKVLKSKPKAHFHGRALEIGAGFGYYAELFHKTTSVPVDVVEPSNACIDVIKKMNFGGDHFKRIQDIHPDVQYDEIFCFHVAEHFQRFDILISAVTNRLKIGGRFWILTPNGASTSFSRFRLDWGWANPTQHYEFLTQSISQNYFYRHSLKIISIMDVSPAVIHYPSVILSLLNILIRNSSESIKSKHGVAEIAHRAVRKISRIFSIFFVQNKTNWNLCMIEKAISKILSRRPFDELFIVLEKLNSKEIQKKIEQ